MELRISPQLISMFENNEDPWGIKIFKGKQSFYFYSNPANYRLFNLPSKFDFSGKSDSEIPHPISEFAENFQKHDLAIQEIKKNITSIDIYPYGKHSLLQPYICEKFPFFDSGKCVGVIFHSKKMEIFNFREFNRFDKFNKLDCTAREEFTPRELEIIFLTFHSFTAKEVSKTLGISHYTVNNKLQLVHQKLGISFRGQLIEYCIANNIHKKIPPGLLKPRSFLI